jgi:hypothetical protein
LTWEAAAALLGLQVEQQKSRMQQAAQTMVQLQQQLPS